MASESIDWFPFKKKKRAMFGGREINRMITMQDRDLKWSNAVTI